MSARRLLMLPLRLANRFTTAAIITSVMAVAISISMMVRPERGVRRWKSILAWMRVMPADMRTRQQRGLQCHIARRRRERSQGRGAKPALAPMPSNMRAGDGGGNISPAPASLGEDSHRGARGIGIQSVG